MRASRLALVVLLIAPPWTALAQMPNLPQPAVAAPAPAPALPGLAARRAPAPIQGDPTANLSPNASLFDAVNRGDLAAARDAVGRGANLDARNALGLTALDAAVDQGRNDIAFYLLSARDLSRSPPPSAGPASLGAPPAARPEPRRTAAPAPAGPATPRNARLWANDGGTPQPDIGFMGFDAGRPARGPGRS
jgi:ankyrin repeat protein